jgi:hypothetical protein
MPVILTYGEAKRWINSGTPLSRITAILKQYDSKLMNAYPIDPKIKNPEENDKQLIQPIGPRLLIVPKSTPIKYPYTSGYHQSRRSTKTADISTIAERLVIAKANESQLNN